MASFTEQDMKHSDTEQDKIQIEVRKKDIPCNNSDEKFRYIYIRYDHLSDSQNAYEVIPENGELFTQFVNGNRNLYELNTVKRKQEPEIPDQAISCFSTNKGKGRNEIFYQDGSIFMYYYPSDYESDYDVLYNAIKQINGIRKKPGLSDLIIFRNKMNSADDITMSRINTAIVRNKVSSVSLPIMSLLNLNMGEWENESYVTTLIDHTQEDWKRHDPSVCVHHSIMHTLGAWHMHNIVNTCITIDKEIGEKHYQNYHTDLTYIDPDSNHNNISNAYYFDVRSVLLLPYPREVYNVEETKRKLKELLLQVEQNDTQSFHIFSDMGSNESREITIDSIIDNLDEFVNDEFEKMFERKTGLSHGDVKFIQHFLMGLRT